VSADVSPSQIRDRILRMADAVGPEGELDDDAIRTLRKEGFQVSADAVRLHRERERGGEE